MFQANTTLMSKRSADTYDFKNIGIFHTAPMITKNNNNNADQKVYHEFGTYKLYIRMGSHYYFAQGLEKI